MVPNTHAHTHTHTYTNTRTHIHTQTRTHMYTRTRTHTRTHTCMHTQTHSLQQHELSAVCLSPVSVHLHAVGDALEGVVSAEPLVRVGRVHAAGEQAHAALGLLDGEGRTVSDRDDLVH